MTARLRQIAWVAHYLGDLESDFSAIHKVDDMYSLDAPQFFRKAWRMSAYPGVMQMRVNNQQDRPAEPARAGATAAPNRESAVLSVTELMVTMPGLIDRVTV